MKREGHEVEGGARGGGGGARGGGEGAWGCRGGGGMMR